MRLFVNHLRTLTLAALIAAPAFAEAPPPAAPGEPHGLEASLLLMNKGVQEELKMTPEQIRKIHKVIEDTWAKYRDDFKKALRDKDGKKYAQLMHQSTEETRSKIHKLIPDVLKPAQLHRLRQIEIQVNGLTSFAHPEIQKELKLADQQKKEIKEIDDGLKEDVAELFKDPEVRKNPERKIAEATRKANLLAEAATKKTLAVLTEEQKKKWEEMIGPKFHYKPDVKHAPPAGPRP